MTTRPMNLRALPALRHLLIAAVVLAFAAAGCAADSSDEVQAEVDEAADQAADAADDAADAVDEATDEAAEEADEAMEETDGDAEEMVDDAATEADEQVDEAAEEIDERSAAIAQALRDNDMESLATAVEQIDASELVGDGEFTFFGPNDDAFLELDADELADLLSDPAALSEVLQAHIVTERLDAATLAGMTSVETRGGTTLSVSVDGDTITVGDATVVNADIDAADGVIHVIDSVIMP